MLQKRAVFTSEVWLGALLHCLVAFYMSGMFLIRVMVVLGSTRTGIHLMRSAVYVRVLL